jgi:hypothetical protein
MAMELAPRSNLPYARNLGLYSFLPSVPTSRARVARRKHAKLLDHRIHDRCRLQELAHQWASIHVETHGLQDSPCATAAMARDTSVVGHNRRST